jgi:hypothetical protein
VPLVAMMAIFLVSILCLSCSCWKKQRRVFVGTDGAGLDFGFISSS